MKKKRLIVAGYIILSIALVYTGCYRLIIWLNEPMYPDIPEISSQGKVTLTSDGCCFWTSDTTVFLLDSDGNKSVLIEAESVYFHEIFESENIPDYTTPVQIGIDFTSHYAIEENVSLMVGEFTNTSELQKKGLLLYFGDGNLIVRNGNIEKKFAAGVFGDGGNEEPWFQVR